MGTKTSYPRATSRTEVDATMNERASELESAVGWCGREYREAGLAYLDGDDATQDTFEHLWKRWPVVPTGPGFTGYGVVTTRHRVRKQIARKGYRTVALSDWTPYGATHGISAIYVREIVSILTSGLAVLTPRQREAFCTALHQP